MDPLTLDTRAAHRLGGGVLHRRTTLALVLCALLLAASSITHEAVAASRDLDLQFAQDELALTADPEEVACGFATVVNVGDVDATDIHFDASTLIGDTYGQVLPAAAVSFDPASLAIPHGQSDDVEICVAIFPGMRADTYEGVVSLLADGELLFDELALSVTVNAVPALDILNNGYNVIGNVMALWPEALGYADTGQFEVENTGNTALGDVTLLDVVGLPSGLSVEGMISSGIPWNGSQVGYLSVSWNDPATPAGTYETTVTVTAAGGATSDSFILRVIVSELPSVAFTEEILELSGGPGDLLQISFGVANTGNAAIDEGAIEFLPTDLVGDGGDFIPGDYVSVEPPTAPIPYGEIVDFVLTIPMPGGLSSSFYSGTLELYLEGEWQDELLVSVSIVSPVEGSFYAEPSEANAVVLRWTAASLAGIDGFNVYRSIAREGPFEKLNDALLEPCTPGHFVDTSVWPEETFWYELRAVFADGTEDVMQGSPTSASTGGRLSLALHSPHPNPFTRDTALQFDVPAEGKHVSVAVYDARGRLVTTLVDRPLRRGRHEVRWSGTDAHGSQASSGVYFVKLRAGGRETGRKILLMR